MKVSIILNNKGAYAIFLQRLDGGEVPTKRGSVVPDRPFGKENEMDPDELAGSSQRLYCMY